MTDVRGGRIRIVLSATDENFTATLAKAERLATQAQGSFGKVSTTVRHLGDSAATTESSMLRLAQAQARQLSAMGNHAGAANILSNALSQTSQNTVQTTNATTQLIREQQLAAGSTKGLANGLTSLIHTIGPIATFFAARQFATFAADLISAANEMEKVQAKTLALAGSQERFDEIMVLARKNTSLFGGSLKDNIDSLGTFVNLSNRTGVELGKLENVARRLAIVDPVNLCRIKIPQIR
jgi:hypothetical protein